jgi:uncharacterized protein (TIGR00251 family)
VDKAKTGVRIAITGVRIAIKVQPRAKKTELAGKIGDAYKLRLAAPPVDGKANDACVRFLADRFGVPQSAVRIVQGLSSRMKIVEIDGADPAKVERVLNHES